MRLAICALSLALIGCGPPAYLARFSDLAKAGQCDAADSEIARGGADSGEKFLMMAAVAKDCRKDDAVAIRYLTLGARHGNAGAQHFLTKLGHPVPPADLAARPGSPMVVCTKVGTSVICQ